jgi:DivIVA domain-containing protein
MPLTPEDVANKQFASTRLKPGYDETQVDEFLDEVEAELTRLYRENGELRSKLAAAQRSVAEAGETAGATTQKVAPSGPAGPSGPAQKPPQPPATGQSAPAPAAAAEGATGILALAQRIADEHVAEARTQADHIVGEARTRADALKREADDRHRQMIGSLEKERTTLDRTVGELRTFERDYRARLKSYLEDQLRDLTSRDGAAPAPGQRPTGGQQGDPARRPVASGAPVGEPGDGPSAPPEKGADGGPGSRQGSDKPG